MERGHKDMSLEALRSALTEKQLAFAEALVEGLEPVAAARKAGFGEKIAGAQAAKMLKNEKVLAYRKALEKPQCAESEVTPPVGLAEAG